MAFNTYDDLKASVAGWIHRADLTGVIPDLIAFGEARIFREVRARVMETAFTDTIASGVIALPTDYIEMKFAYINSNPVQHLKRREARFIYEKYPSRAAGGLPKYFAREGSNFIFGPYPDSDYSVKGVYYKNIGSVADSAHALYTENPDLYVFAALAETTSYIKDDKRIAVWESKYQNIRDAVNGLAEREDFSGSDLQMTAQ